MFEKWFGARMNGPSAGTFELLIARVRYMNTTGQVTTIRARSYVHPAPCVRDHSWIGWNCDAGRLSL
jgi:hypothetical protein